MTNKNFLQEIFDIGASHLLTQGEKSVDKTLDLPRCAYDNGKGLHCAAWPFIHDYKTEYEGLAVKNLEAIYQVFSDTGYNTEEIEMITSLQYLHDREEVCEWKNELKELAYENGLSTKVLDNF